MLTSSKTAPIFWLRRKIYPAPTWLKLLQGFTLGLGCVIPFLNPTICLATPIDNGTTFLTTHQQANGSWVSSKARSVQATTEAVRALQILSAGTAVRTAAVSFLQSDPIQDTDDHARRIEVLKAEGRNVTTELGLLLAEADPLGGWGLTPEFSADPLDTALALLALAGTSSANAAQVADAISFLIASRNPDGGWGCVLDGPSDVSCTAQVLLSLIAYRTRPGIGSTLTAALTFLKSVIDPDGSVGNAMDDLTYTTALAANALATAGTDLGNNRTSIIAFLQSGQGVDGSWEGDPLLTAVALRALRALETLPVAPVCGDGSVNDPVEECDSTNLAGETCTSLGLGDGTLRCTASCNFDVSGCLLVDADHDGFRSTQDCNDNDPSVNPGRVEVPLNGKDDDCNPGTLDVPTDTDSDGDGSPNFLDCRPLDPTVNRGRPEIPRNGKDDDCTFETFDNYCSLDFDGDGWDGLDCPDDSQPLINPGRAEIPNNGKDDDCNPATPDVPTLPDADGDGWSASLDCNDADPMVHPGRTEVLHNGKDDDCNLSTWGGDFLFSFGDVLVGIDDGRILHFTPQGRLLQILDTGVCGQEAGMCFDAVGNLYTTNFQGLSMSKFSRQGERLQQFWGGPFSRFPESCVLDGVGNFYVGEVGVSPNDKEAASNIRKFDPQGNLLASFDTVVARGSDWIDLAADQCTIFYTSEGSRIMRFDTCTNAQLPDFCTFCGNEMFALRIHSDGSVFVAEGNGYVPTDGYIRRFDSTGRQMRTYDAPGLDRPFGLNLDPDGVSVWTADLTGGEIFRFDIATGALLTQFNIGFPSLIRPSKISGLTVFGQRTAGRESTCIDFTDNDQDERIDCADEDCALDPVCAPSPVTDADGDGWPTPQDCNDADPNIHPGQTEILTNGKDDDCNPGTPDTIPAEELSCTVVTDKISYGAREDIRTDVVVKRTAGAGSLVGLQLAVQAAHESTLSLGANSETLAPLNPNERRERRFSFPTGVTPPGQVSISVQILADSQVVASCSTTTSISSSAAQGISLDGAIEANPSVAVFGDTVSLGYSVRNIGNITLNPAHVEILVVDLATTDVVATLTDTSPLNPGATHMATQTAPSSLPPGQYLAILRAGGSIDTLATLASDALLLEGKLDHFLCYKTRNTKGSLCSEDAPLNTGKSCEDEVDCGGIDDEDDETDFCIPNKFPRGLHVGLVDSLESKEFDVKKSAGLCTPADKNGEGISDSKTHIQSYLVKETMRSCAASAPQNPLAACTIEEDCGGVGSGSPPTSFCQRTPKHAPRANIVVSNQLGALVVSTKKPNRLLVPTAKDPEQPVEPPVSAEHDVDHFKCYTVKVTANVCEDNPAISCKSQTDCTRAGLLGPCNMGFPKNLQVSLADQFTEPDKLFDVKRPRRLCLPVNKNTEGIKNPNDHLMCYQVKPTTKVCSGGAPQNPGATCKKEEDCGGMSRQTNLCVSQPKHTKRIGVYVNNQFGAAQLDVVKEDELCVPSTADLR